MGLNRFNSDSSVEVDMEEHLISYSNIKTDEFEDDDLQVKLSELEIWSLQISSFQRNSSS